MHKFYPSMRLHPTFAKELGLFIIPTNVGMQKINSTTLDIYEIEVAIFSVTNKGNQ